MGVVKDEVVCTDLILYIRINFALGYGFAKMCWCKGSDMAYTINCSLQMFQGSGHMKEERMLLYSSYLSCAV